MARKLSTCALTSAVNASAYNQAEDPKVRALLRFIQTNEPGEDPFAKQLKEFVLKARQNEKFKREYLAMNLHDRDMMKIGEKEGIAKGAQAKAIETARNMLKKNYPASDIVEITGLSLEQVLELQKELAAEPAHAN